ncbi:DOMON domain-containing protein frrs1L [Mactra antiquata]
MYEFITYVVLLLSVVCCCHSYSLGPPDTVCESMLPNHNVSVYSAEPAPFSFRLNATEYGPGDVIEVFVKAEGQWFMEGTMIQARTVECQGGVTSVGEFSVQASEDFLKPMKCFKKKASALVHYSHLHIYNRTFFWTAPSEPVGHVFLKATFVRNVKIFWMNVHSPFIFDKSNSTRTGLNKDFTCGADVNRAAMTLLIGITTLVYLLKI